MIIPLNTKYKRVLLLWLQRGEIDTSDIKELKGEEGKNFFESLMQELPDNPEFERKTIGR